MIAIPARDEAAALPGCLLAIDRAAACWGGAVEVVVLANGCRDGTVAACDIATTHARVRCVAASPLPGWAHAGWARRAAFDAAAALLERPDDILLGTDADTLVAPDWIVRNARHLAGGADAVAGRALTLRAERAAHGPEGRRRLDLIGRYYTALDRLRADRAPDARDPWPRHHYEGGASIALTLGAYRAIGGAPMVPLGEDKALFDAVRAAGGRVRHPVDVRVFTSCRTDGRAAGGMADTVAEWLAQGEDAPLHGTFALPQALTPDVAGPEDRLTFRTLPAALAAAQAAIRRSRAAPEVEPVAFVALGEERADRVAQRIGERGNGVVARQRIVGLAGPVDEEHVAA